ncbi:hypothetical protein GCM10011611_02300 [Aliidongia dinghuensis]|uniref:Uncharacterized protein n=1 Tax=Aliidongia dinghuensis TaxID=1867774 RepID=A0A8J2YP91_9PROT|nr:hypothetical protein [Aliidongia dinghuensis]GGF00236.1 hypothetical protein GCM10011611_02300 [Aliidongia dinghuensis]
MTAPRELEHSDLILSSRRPLELRLAKESELGAITSAIDDAKPIKGVIHTWQAIAMVDPVAGAATLRIVGLFEACPWITSDARELSHDRSLVRTRNSVYALGHPVDGTLSPSHLRAVVWALDEWGLADRYGLELMSEIDIERAVHGRHES